MPNEMPNDSEGLVLHYMANQLRMVDQFHRKFGIDAVYQSRPCLPDREMWEFRLKFLREELREMTEAYERGDTVKFFDALIDLSYVTYGTALFSGITPEMWEAGFMAVHIANMQKERAQSAGDSLQKTGRGHATDIVKPPGWQSAEPVLAKILGIPDAIDVFPNHVRELQGRIERLFIETCPRVGTISYSPVGVPYTTYSVEGLFDDVPKLCNQLVDSIDVSLRSTVPTPMYLYWRQLPEVTRLGDRALIRCRLHGTDQKTWA